MSQSVEEFATKAGKVKSKYWIKHLNTGGYEVAGERTGE